MPTSRTLRPPASALLPALFCLLASAACNRAPAPEQPVAFPHRVHVEKKIRCTFCHAGAEKNSKASLPSVTLCMTCHSAVKTDHPEIVKAKQFLDAKTEIPWRRVYGFEPEADVFFNHHRHAAGGVPCAKCHGDVASSTVVRREVDLKMGFCVQCHRSEQKKFRSPQLADDCSTCHR